MAEKKKPKGRLFVILTAIFTTVGCVLAYFFLAAMGEKAGVEFSPDDFTFRKFNYCKLPLLNWTRRGIEYKNFSNSTAGTLVSDDWIRPTGRTPKRWHLVNEGQNYYEGYDHDSEGYSVACDARFLTKYFNMSDVDGVNRVTDWTDKQPKSAKVFWPLIADMARGNIYLQIPEVMEFALEYPNPDQSDRFDSELRQHISDAWYQAGLLSQIKTQHKLAITRFDKAIKVAGEAGHPDALAAKKESLAASP